MIFTNETASKGNIMLLKELIQYIVSLVPYFYFDAFATYNNEKYKTLIEIIKNSEKAWHRENFKERMNSFLQPFYIHKYSHTIHGDYNLQNESRKYFYGFLVYVKKESLEEWYELPTKDQYELKSKYVCEICEESSCDCDINDECTCGNYYACTCEDFHESLISDDADIETIKSITYKGNTRTVVEYIKTDTNTFDYIESTYIDNVKEKEIYSMKDGYIIKNYYKSGNIRDKCSYRGVINNYGHKMGCEKLYFDLSTKIVQRKIFYVEGIEYKRLIYFNTGVLSRKIYGHKINSFGKDITYYPSGNVKIIVKKYSGRSSNGKAFSYCHGKALWFYDKKNCLRISGRYNYGKQHGEYKWFKESGEIGWIDTWNNGFLEKEGNFYSV